MASTSCPSGATPVEPEIFNARGLVVDTRLQIFGAVFHVHSAILKLYSHYFATYMDSADKAKSTACNVSEPANAYQYEWVSKVLEGGNNWQLVCAGPKARDLSVAPSGIDQDKETTAFRNLLNAMYNTPYTLHADEIVALTKIARFYMALPVVSRSLDRVFRQSVNFIGKEIRTPRCYAMIWCLGPFSDPIYSTLEDLNLKRLADHMYFRLSADINGQHYALIAQATDVRNSRDEVLAMLNKEITLSKKIRDSNGGKLLVPKLFRDLYEGAKYGGGVGVAKKFVLDNFELELQSHLSLGNIPCIEAGNDVHDCQDYFLTNKLEADDYPWDVTEIDW